MLGSGRLSKMLPIKEGNQIVTRLVEQDGPIAYIESTTLTNIFDEDKNRCLLLAADESTKQTRSVINRLAASYGAMSLVNVAAIAARHHGTHPACYSNDQCACHLPRKLANCFLTIASKRGEPSHI